MKGWRQALLVAAIMCVAVAAQFGWWVIAGGAAAGLLLRLRDRTFSA